MKVKQTSVPSELYIALGISTLLIIINIILTVHGMSPFDYLSN